MPCCDLLGIFWTPMKGTDGVGEWVASPHWPRPHLAMWCGHGLECISHCSHESHPLPWSVSPHHSNGCPQNVLTDLSLCSLCCHNYLVPGQDYQHFWWRMQEHFRPFWGALFWAVELASLDCLLDSWAGYLCSVSGCSALLPEDSLD